MGNVVVVVGRRVAGGQAAYGDSGRTSNDCFANVANGNADCDDCVLGWGI